MKFLIFALSLVGFVGAKTCADFDSQKCVDFGIIPSPELVECGTSGNWCNIKKCCDSGPKTCASASYPASRCTSRGKVPVDSPEEVSCNPYCNHKICCMAECTADSDCDEGETCGLDGVCAPEVVIGCSLNSDCDDGDALTDDICEAGVCVNTPIVDPECTADSDCDDSDAMTEDTCVDGSCVYTTIVEDDECISNPDCDDGDALTDDICEAPSTSNGVSVCVNDCVANAVEGFGGCVCDSGFVLEDNSCVVTPPVPFLGNCGSGAGRCTQVTGGDQCNAICTSQGITPSLGTCNNLGSGTADQECIDGLSCNRCTACFGPCPP